MLYLVLVDGLPMFKGNYYECERYIKAYYRNYIDVGIVSHSLFC